MEISKFNMVGSIAIILSIMGFISSRSQEDLEVKKWTLVVSAILGLIAVILWIIDRSKK